MKKVKWSLLMLCALTVLGLVSCSDWGAEDPPAGTDVYPTYSKIFLYDFNDEENNPTPMDLFSNGGELPMVVNDEQAGMVLRTVEGYARFANLLNGDALDKGVNGYAGLTFLVKMPGLVDGADERTEDYDRGAVLVSFQSIDGKQRLNFDANGGLVYDGPDGDVAFNADVKTGMLDRPDEWHSVAIQVAENGYTIYVDGMKKVNENSGSFDMKKVAAFMKNAPYIYINNGYYTDKTSDFYIDDFALYRGKLKDADLKDKRPGSHGGGGGTEFNLNVVGSFLIDGFMNPEIQFVTQEPQATPSAIEVDPERGTVWHQQEGWVGHGNGLAYLEIPNPLKGKALEGATFSFWVKQPNVNWWDTIFGVTDENGRVWFNGGGYLGVNASGQWFDCQQDNGDNSIPANTWTHVIISFSTEGFTVYYNGEEKFSDKDNAKWASSGDIDYANALNFIASCNNVYFGHGSFWGAANSYISDFVVLENYVDAAGAQALYGLVKTDDVAWYPLDGSMANKNLSVNTATIITEETQATPSDFETDERRGTVWHQQEGWIGHANGLAYLQIPNVVKGKSVEGATFSFWVKQPGVNWWDTIFGVTDAGLSGRVWYNGNGYFAVNASGQWFDCQQDNGDNSIPANAWTHVTLVYTTEGFTVYYDGEEKFSSEVNAKWASSGDIDYANVMNFITSCDNVYFGHGSFWGAANTYISDFVAYTKALNAKEVKALYMITRK